ncbi:MAG: hypothetical protein EB056_03960, partial [Verrucomicrobia bacterium]|nr:hypothetical protein [Verrucomicrobiota bacterium]
MHDFRGGCRPHRTGAGKCEGMDRRADRRGQRRGQGWNGQDCRKNRWIRHGDWYPDWQTRLWKVGKAKWGGVDPHDRLEVEGRVATLHGNLLHYSNPSISSYVSKINYFSDLYLEARLKKGTRWSPGEASFRALWRFIRAYFFRLGFLDGFPGFYIAA